MQNSEIARPYATALFELAAVNPQSETDGFKAWSDILSELTLIAVDDNMQNVISNPRVDSSVLTDIILSVMTTKNETAINLVKLLAQNKRLAFIPDIAEIFEVLQSEAAGEIELEVVSAYELDEAQQASIKSVMEQRLGGKTRISHSVDKNLIGGAVVRYGDEVIDLSLRGRLNQMQQALS